MRLVGLDWIIACLLGLLCGLLEMVEDGDICHQITVNGIQFFKDSKDGQSMEFGK